MINLAFVINVTFFASHKSLESLFAFFLHHDYHDHVTSILSSLSLAIPFSHFFFATKGKKEKTDIFCIKRHDFASAILFQHRVCKSFASHSVHLIKYSLLLCNHDSSHAVDYFRLYFAHLYKLALRFFLRCPRLRMGLIHFLNSALIQLANWNTKLFEARKKSSLLISLIFITND